MFALMKPAGSTAASVGKGAVPFNMETILEAMHHQTIFKGTGKAPFKEPVTPPRVLLRHGRDINLSQTMRGSTQMVNKDQVKGTAKQVAGSVKEAAGKVTGSRETEAKGKIEKAAGKVQKAYGDAKEDMKDAMRR
jgi:uncharacterized protein YjbJ (UPF0337 family)